MNDIQTLLQEYQKKGFHFTFSGDEWASVNVNWFGKFNQEAQQFEDMELSVYAPENEWTFFEMFATLDLWAETHKERME